MGVKKLDGGHIKTKSLQRMEILALQILIGYFIALMIIRKKREP